MVVNFNKEFIWNSANDSNLLLVKNKSRRNENLSTKLNGKEKPDKHTELKHIRQLLYSLCDMIRLYAIIDSTPSRQNDARDGCVGVHVIGSTWKFSVAVKIQGKNQSNGIDSNLTNEIE